MAESQGVNNQVWSVDTAEARFWLRKFPIDERDWRIRELELLDRIAAASRSTAIAIAVPEAVATIGGDRLFLLGDYLWYLTQDLPGKMPRPADAHVYPHLARGLAHLHELMSADPAAVPVAPTNIRDDLLANLKLQQDCHDTPELVWRGEEILQSQILRLRAEPTRLIHGDFAHPNLRVDGQTNRLIGVLDFEFCSRDPFVLDFATLVLTVLVRSEVPDPSNVITAMTGAYVEILKVDLDVALVRASVVARKLDSFWYHRNQILQGHGGREVVDRQLAQLRLVLCAIDEGII